MNQNFSVHKGTVICYRNALALHFFRINRARDIPEIMEQLYDLNSFHGTRVPAEAVANEINIVISLLQDEYLCLKVISLIDIELLPLYKGIKLCIDHFLKAEVEIPFILLCRLVVRYFTLITESVSVKLTEEKDLLRLDFVSNIPKLISSQHMEGILLEVHKIISKFSSVNLTKLTLSHDKSFNNIDIYKKLFGVSAELSSLTNSLYYPLKSIRNTVLAEEYVEILGRNLFIGPLHNILNEEFYNSSYTQHCQHIILTIMGVTQPTRQQVAKVLNMSVSSLQRRLRDEGTSFQNILLTSRKTMAHQYLIDQKKSAAEVALLLGYQSRSHFFKAFKAWYSMTPLAYQKLSHPKSELPIIVTHSEF